MSVLRPRPPDEPSSGSLVVPDPIGLDVELFAGVETYSLTSSPACALTDVGEPFDARRGAPRDPPARCSWPLVLGDHPRSLGRRGQRGVVDPWWERFAEERAGEAGDRRLLRAEPAERVVVKTTAPVGQRAAATGRYAGYAGAEHATRDREHHGATSFRAMGPALGPRGDAREGGVCGNRGNHVCLRCRLPTDANAVRATVDRGTAGVPWGRSMSSAAAGFILAPPRRESRREQHRPLMVAGPVGGIDDRTGVHRLDARDPRPDVHRSIGHAPARSPMGGASRTCSTSS